MKLHSGKLSLLFILLFSSLLLPKEGHALKDRIYKELEIFSRVIEIVDKQYVEEVDEHHLIEGAVQGMLNSLDPHSVYFTPKMYKDFQSDTTGRFGGIGLEITLKDNLLTVVSPIEGSPAYNAGIRSGDRILKIDGESSRGINIVDAVNQMRGKKGKKVELTIWREGFAQPKTVTITREIIKMEMVKYELTEDGYGYLRIISFQDETASQVKKYLLKMEEEKGSPLKGIIIDLRDNPGGLLTEAVGVADLFMTKGVIVSTRDRNEEIEVNKARKNSPFENLPIVVLVNHGSASASEIVAGALQDTKRAKILGLQSYGKGSVQTIIELENRAAVKLTIAKYYTPKGRSIDGKGIEPDIKLGMEELKKDFFGKKGEKLPKLKDYQKQWAMSYLRKHSK